MTHFRNICLCCIQSHKCNADALNWPWIEVLKCQEQLRCLQSPGYSSSHPRPNDFDPWVSLNCKLACHAPFFFFLFQGKDFGFDKSTLSWEVSSQIFLKLNTLKHCHSMWKCSVRMPLTAYALREDGHYILRVGHSRLGFWHLFCVFGQAVSDQREQNTEMIA